MELKYRPEIDGLRTIAVLVVIIYHVEVFFGNVQLLKGGFFGVDVFFVISGFLITSIIMGEYYRTGKFSITNFYERRARRILPALFLVILVSLPLAWNLLLPSQLVDYAKSILSTLAFGSNFYWDVTLQEYGAESALIKPFLHTWTLAVEEQYYIAFPLILLAIYKWAKQYTIAILTATFLLSLLFAQALTGIDAASSFYMLPSRFWELLAGSLLANILYLHPQKDNNAILNRTMPVLGLFLIAYSIIFVDFDAHHPGFITLLPVLGTVLIIWFANENDLITQVLSSKPFVAVGLISYSLYLWHYPIFAFGRLIDMEPGWHNKVQWIVLTFVLSVASYFILEKPARNGKLISSRFFVAITIIVALAISALLVKIIKDVSISDGYGSIDFKAEKKKRFAWEEYSSGTCNQKDHKTPCIANPKAEKNILVVGDSMTPDAFRIVAKLYPEYHYILNWSGGCHPMRNVTKKFKSGDRLKQCKWLNELRYNQEYMSDIDGVIINTLHAKASYIDDYVRYLKQNGLDNILIFGNYLRSNNEMLDLLIEYGDKETVIQMIKSEELIPNDLTYDKEMLKLSQKEQIDFIRVRDYACSSLNECMIFLGEVPYSWDRQHFTVEFTDFLSEQMRYDIAKTWLGKPQ